ncbi:KTSC domain-containing protein [Candidatus Phyllobacterium onerii]|uniref:KTSC domain-containing protein n=1 Tax=Candidatus Phyllobacterium onerii TaxID=3020828 RepID=UPI00232E643E|nr:KTSC domain-containing protein [Phyllobacterium sp. IY22]
MPSSLIRESSYDEISRTLSIWFVTNGRRYDYLDVPPDIYAGFRRAFSKGRYFNQHIRDQYRYRVALIRH